MLFGMDPTTDALDASQGAGTCAAYVTSGTLTCVAELAPGGAYAGYCNAICGFDFINYPDLYPDSIWAQIATNFVVPWLEEMGQPSTVAEAVARMVPATVTSDGVASPGLCEQLIESLGYERMCRGQPGVSASGVYPGVLHPEMCHSGPGGHWDVLGATFGYCEGMCDFACGECQNTGNNPETVAVASLCCARPTVCSPSYHVLTWLCALQTCPLTCPRPPPRGMCPRIAITERAAATTLLTPMPQQPTLEITPTAVTTSLTMDARISSRRTGS